jgi:peptidyl-prolyl cis-trans isomerase D
MKNYSAIPDSSVTITRSDLESYYSEHKEDYKRNALRDIEYVIFEVLPSEDDIKQAEQWINKTREEFAASDDPVQFINLTADTRHTGFYTPLDVVPENLREFIKKEDLKSVFGPYQEDGSFKIARLIGVAERPDSVHARHILLAPNQTRSSEQTRAMADSLVNLIKSGSPFEALAIANSDDQSSAQIGGDLGWFPEGRMVVPFNNACFTAKKGEIVTAETNYGIHIINILEKSKNSRKYEIGIVDRKILASSATNQRIYSEASQFAGTNDTYDKFIASIAAQNLTKRVANDVIPTQKALPGLENPRSLVISLFSTGAGKIVLDNSEQAVFEVGNNYVVGFCTKAQEEGIAPIEDVESEIRFNLLREKKAEIISGEFTKTKEPGKTLDDIARETGLTVQEATQVNFRSYTLPGVGNEPALVAAASAAKQGVVTGPVTGNNGVYMFYVNGITLPEGEDLKMLRERLMSTLQMRGSYEAYEALRKGANIVDKRYKFY